MEMMMAMALNTYFDFKVLIHWLTNRTKAKSSGKAFYNDVEVMAGDCFSTEWSWTIGPPWLSVCLLRTLSYEPKNKCHLSWGNLLAIPFISGGMNSCQTLKISLR